MNTNLVILLKLVAFLIIFIYNLQMFSYSETIINRRFKGKNSYIITSIINVNLLHLLIKFGISIAIIYLIFICILFIEFFILYDSEILAIFFGCENFILHITLLRMLVLSVFSIIFDLSIYHIIHNEMLYLFSIIISTLLLSIFLIIFKSIIYSKNLRLIVKNKEQLKYLGIALTIMNIYIVITSMLYNRNSSNDLVSLLILSTSVMIFLVLYNLLNRTIKLVIMAEYKRKSMELENELIKNRENQKQLESIAFYDELTGLYNRRCAMLSLEKLIKSNLEFSICFVDIDGLKYVNDILGHNEGDEYIKIIANIISNEFYDEDKVCRVGGDEFLILLPNCNESLALKRANELFEKVIYQAENIKKEYVMSISYGVTHVNMNDDIDLTEIINLADKNMYKFKNLRKKSRDIY
ncbi:GGDEF domain-containing protein [Clostridium botulinum]|uniref:GGDEF domain-containing protein n=3 Tax=Clostridium botulinum TaxID=1491 RepID=A0A6B4JJ78_CLOBO|nr:GGDEF domain-containing protein [Clostridium botulinum]MBY6760404.1 GGDEF domain-containing protein [Clostridium botulinum]MBY6919311.1 GGDEF domain-containing protein [Clostridium botulinum]NFH69148.1 GGDEF domain-containing protein [Clostridium botulinum]NFJ57048.1 GGDEF domain-containing protein [Clostridium botulinum]NFL53967.1 GGDEF domain-containing protein [Clostridium botulinum]